MPSFTVRVRGTDSSGRTIYATDYMWDWWRGTCDALGFTPTVIQGGFMVRNGGGASESAGYHDAGGCLDLRVWDLTTQQVDQVIRATRRRGAGSWVRDAQRGGMDPHIHLVLGTDSPLASGAAWQWSEYVEGNDGLAGRGADYEWRPRPLVLTPPPEGFVMDAEAKAAFAKLTQQNDTILKRLGAQAAIRKRLARLVEQGQATRKDLADLQRDFDAMAGDGKS